MPLHRSGNRRGMTPGSSLGDVPIVTHAGQD